MTDIESRLREFHPRRPAAIPDERLQVLRGPIWLAVAAGLAAVMLVALWMRTPQRPPGISDTLGALTQIALERPQDFDSELARISAVSLPDVTKPDGALAPFARGF